MGHSSVPNSKRSSQLFISPHQDVKRVTEPLPQCPVSYPLVCSAALTVCDIGERLEYIDPGRLREGESIYAAMGIPSSLLDRLSGVAYQERPKGKEKKKGIGRKEEKRNYTDYENILIFSLRSNPNGLELFEKQYS